MSFMNPTQMAKKCRDFLCKDDDTVFVKKCLRTVEEKTKAPREYIVLGIAGLFALYLVVGYFAELVCNVAAFAYPAYKSMNAIVSHDKADDTQWLTYWTVFGVYSIIDFMSDRVIGWFPIYWLVKFIFLLYLYMPGLNGAKNIWDNHLNPLVTKLEEKKLI